MTCFMKFKPQCAYQHLYTSYQLFTFFLNIKQNPDLLEYFVGGLLLGLKLHQSPCAPWISQSPVLMILWHMESRRVDFKHSENITVSVSPLHPSNHFFLLSGSGGFYIIRYFHFVVGATHTLNVKQLTRAE